MDFAQVSTVVAIVVITYLIGLGAKAIPQIPVIIEIEFHTFFQNK